MHTIVEKIDFWGLGKLFGEVGIEGCGVASGICFVYEGFVMAMKAWEQI